MSVEFGKPIDFNRQLPNFESRFPQEMDILRLGGVYPREKNEGIVNPYTGEVDKDYYGNIGEHCVAVARCAEIIADKILGEDHSLKRTIVGRALVHDATKRFEIMRRKAMEEGIIDDAYSPKAYDTIKPLLEAKGIASDIIEYMVNAGSETGHISFVDFVQVHNGEVKLKTENNLSEMIVHLADDMTHTPIVQAGESAETRFLTTPERMEASNFPERYPFLYKEGFGFDKDGNPVFVKDVSQDHRELFSLKTYAQWQAWIAQAISSHLVSLISPQGQVEDPQEYLKHLANTIL